MPRIHAEAAAVLDAPPGAVYAILADYRHGHPAILPRKHFSNLVVERGGTGDGTIIRFEITLGGTTRSTRAAITEPEPGRMLLETDLDTGAVTRFTVDPVSGPAPPGGAARSRVTITTVWSTPGLRGSIERVLAPRLLQKVYAEELRNLGSAVQGGIS